MPGMSRPGGGMGGGFPGGSSNRGPIQDFTPADMSTTSGSWEEFRQTGLPAELYERWKQYKKANAWQTFMNRGRGGGSVGSRSYRGPTGPWGSSSPMRSGGQMSPALMQMFGGGGGSEEQLMALLQQLGMGG